jgi:uncharacterized hydrophobic protein (TIGR00271 family)
MLQLRVVCESEDTPGVVEMLNSEPGVVHLTVATGVSRRPPGDVIEAAVVREVAEDVLDRLTGSHIDKRGQISLSSVDMMLSDTADAAERAAPGDSGDAVIWDELIATTGEESQLNPIFIAFLTIACLLATVGVITNSAITIVGAMVVSPDFGPLAALATAIVGKRRDLALRAGIALGAGFLLAMVIAAGLVFVARLVGLYQPVPLSHLNEVSFISHIGPYPVIVALLAGSAGMLALTSQKSGILIGVFISVTTVPAAGFAAVAAVAGQWAQSGGALLQLLINFAGVTAAGTVALRLRRRHVDPRAESSTRSTRRTGRRKAI